MSVQTFAQFDQDKLFYINKIEKYRKMKNTGTALTVAGGVLFVVGVATLVNTVQSTTTTGSSTQTTTSGNLELGLIGYFGGAACLGSGIPLWIIGAHSERKYTRKLEGAYVGFNLAPQKTGLTLTYRF